MKSIQYQLDQVSLGDTRLNTRFRFIVNRILEEEACRSLPHIFSNPAALKATYRLMNHPQVNHQQLIACYFEGLVRLGQQPANQHPDDPWLCVQDSTAVWLNGRQKLDVGYLKSPHDNGLLLHHGLLLTPSFIPVGLLHQQAYQRDRAHYGKKHQRKQRSFSQKESYKWMRGVQQGAAWSQASGQSLIHIMDAEAAIAPLINGALQHQQSFVIRLKSQRKLLHCDQLLKAYLQEQCPAEAVNRTVRDPQGKPYEGCFSLRYATVHLQGMDKPLQVVYLQEQPAVGPEPIEWLLLTDVVVNQRAEAEKVLHYYEQRWSIEDYHKCLKTGCSIENRQFDSSEALLTMIATLSLVGVKLLQSRYLARHFPEQDVREILSDTELSLATLLAEQYLQPQERETSREGSVLWWSMLLARMGGHQGIKQKGPPGWQTLWKGWGRFKQILIGFELQQQ